MSESAIVTCSTCGTPGRVIFDDDGEIEQAFFVCKCPRPSVDEANKANEEAS